MSINTKAFQAYVALVTNALEQGVEGSVRVNTIERLKIEFTSSDMLLIADGICKVDEGKLTHFHVMQDTNSTDVVLAEL